jgi:hypothetical protein
VGLVEKRVDRVGSEKLVVHKGEEFCKQKNTEMGAKGDACRKKV